MQLDLECVASFLLLADEEHFGRAAARLYVSSPALTKRIQRLERQVGVALVDHRARGGFALTTEGQRFLRHARQLLLQARIARNAALEGADGTVRLGVPGRIGDYPGQQQLKTLVDLLHQVRPDACLVCTPVPYPMMDEYLLQRRIDVAWTTSGCDHPALETVPLTMMWRVGVVPERHEFANAVALDVADFADQPMLYNPDIPPGMMGLGCLGDYRSLSDARLVPIRARYSTMVLQTVSRGLGVAVMPAALQPGILAAGLRPITLVGLKPVEIHAVRRHHDTRSLVFDLINLLGTVAVAHATRA